MILSDTTSNLIHSPRHVLVDHLSLAWTEALTQRLTSHDQPLQSVTSERTLRSAPRATTRPTNVLTTLDLFAGAGGLSTGLRAAGFTVVGAVENDATAAATYRLNHPKTKVILSDIRDLTGPALLEHVGLAPGALALLTGCPPCQGFSSLRTHRKVSHTDDPRNDLLFEILRLARSIRPRALIVENVPGLASDHRFDSFRRGLFASGYRNEFAILDATHFGVPQRRKRLVLVALHKRDLPPDWAAATHTVPVTVRQAIGGLPEAGQSGDTLHDLGENRSQAIMRRIRATPADGGSRRDIPSEMACPCHEGNDGYSDVYGRMAWDQASPTITSGCHNPSKGRFLHPEADRAITLREAALLQTFPRNYIFDLSRGKENVARQIGNAFPPLLIKAIAKRLTYELAA